LHHNVPLCSDGTRTARIASTTNSPTWVTSAMDSNRLFGLAADEVRIFADSRG